MNALSQRLVRLLQWTGNITHVVTSIALIVTTLLLVTYLFYEFIDAVRIHTPIQGFLHALGILLLLWTMAELIQTEIGFLKGDKIHVAIFIEVALVVVIREIILLPVKEIAPTWIEVATWILAALALGLTYLAVSAGNSGRLASGTSSRIDQA